ncbi:hypothetical protein BC941DRAFT_424983 [Chlamydoabsidia padenii]|nr:hypothetical protein BC941DRAFT_424983 [Chlamydoabsidia padenii]
MTEQPLNEQPMNDQPLGELVTPVVSDKPKYYFELVPEYQDEQGSNQPPPFAKRPAFRKFNNSQPDGITVNPITHTLRDKGPGPKANIRDLLNKLALAEDSEIETIKKDSVFGEQVTDTDKDIIQQRVALQQKQFAEFENREKMRKFDKVYAIYPYLTLEEMEEALKDCNNNEDEIIVRFTRHAYLLDIRKKVAQKYAPEAERRYNSMTPEQLAAYEQLLRKRSKTLSKTSGDAAKKHYRLGGRLALDDALKQVQENNVDPNKAFEGWSSARVRAYNQIEQNPNSYYYRFNAPGEIQQKGQWSPEEQKLFFARLDELGANGQWGIFAMTIPGRVGYQCSNFYRLLVETGKVKDPNYVLDAKGKAHYLFDKKNSNGTVEKTFRTHNKQAGAGRPTTELPPLPDGSQPVVKRRRATVDKKATLANKRKRRARGWDSDDEDDEDDLDDDDDDIMTMFDDPHDTSGSYTASTRSRTSSRRTRARYEVEEEDTSSINNNKENINNNEGISSDESSGNNNNNNDSNSNDSNNEDNNDESEINNSNNNSTNNSPTAMEEEEEQVYELEWSDEDDFAYDEDMDFINPLPGFIDPITLDEVEKPAISKYGHVMGYNSWIRCLTNWEGKRNICPLTKKPLTKRDLVVLTCENIEEYRNQILNV